MPFYSLPDLAKAVQDWGFKNIGPSDEALKDKSEVDVPWKLRDAGNLLRIAKAAESIDRAADLIYLMADNIKTISRVAVKIEKILNRMEKRERAREKSIDDE